MSISQYFFSNDHQSEVSLQKWDERHPVAFSEANWSDMEFHGFIDAQMYPNFLANETVTKTLEMRLLKTEYGKNGMFFFNSWRKRCMQDKHIEDDDRYELQMWLMHLACSWLSSISKRKMKKSSHDCKNGLESIIELAFQLRAGADQVWQQDAELVLPDEPDSVIADSIAAMPLPVFWQKAFSRCDPAYPLSWSYSNEPESIISFVFVASEDDSDEKSTQNRLQMCFYSAQRHRRALCCPDAPVFGMILHDDILEFYVSFWVGNTLDIRPVLNRYALTFFSDFIECYFLLCRIAEYTSEFLQRQFSEWKAERRTFKRKVEQAVKRPWRKKSRDDVEPDVCFEAEWDGIAENGMTGIDVEGIKQIRDRKTRLLLASVRRQPYSPEKGYPLTRKNKWAFDFVTKADESEEIHTGFSPSIWAKETYLYRDEYEDPAPFFVEDSEEQGTRDDSCMVAQPEDDSRSRKLTLNVGTCPDAHSLPGATGSTKVQDPGRMRDVFVLQPDNLGAPSTSFLNQHSLENSVPLLDCTSIRVC